MSQKRFVPDCWLSDLGSGAGLTVWGFRMQATGRDRCRCLVKAYDDQLMGAGPDTLEALQACVRLLGTKGRRTIALAHPTVNWITYDEAAILDLFAAAQTDREIVARTRSRHLLGCDDTAALCGLANAYGDLFGGAGLSVRSPYPVTVPETSASRRAGKATDRSW
ncbi:hypothetical protein [uncultured Algimonas sp.]|uniref:hypothetical protein n=1 Tax=uncultured Algimonas sp. TaxID=1547920 RepID=UPI002635D5AF|nr:hypothetical protein [uncultured Algimonas sp.]